MFIEVPEGWTVVHSADAKQPCIDYIESHWTDLRPKSLVDQMS